LEWANWWIQFTFDLDPNVFAGAEGPAFTVLVPTNKAFDLISPHLNKTLFGASKARKTGTISRNLFALHYGAESADGVYFTGEYDQPKTLEFAIVRQGGSSYLHDRAVDTRVRIERSEEKTFDVGGGSRITVRFHYIAGIMSTYDMTNRLRIKK
jgi:hypothetical protein